SGSSRREEAHFLNAERGTRKIKLEPPYVGCYQLWIAPLSGAQDIHPFAESRRRRRPQASPTTVCRRRTSRTRSAVIPAPENEPTASVAAEVTRLKVLPLNPQRSTINRPIAPRRLGCYSGL